MSSSFRTTLLLLTVASAVASACSSSGTDVFGGGKSSGAGGASSSSASQGGATSTSASQGGASTSTTTSTSQASTSVASTGDTVASTGSTGVASTTVVASSASMGAGPGGTLPCGDGGDCPQGGDHACCWDAWQTHDPPQGVCVNAPAGQDGCNTAVAQDGLQSRIECALPSDCKGFICCGHRESAQTQMGTITYYQTVMCSDICNYPDIILCDPNDLSFVCPIVQTNNGPVQTICKASQLLPAGYYVCGIP